MKEKSTNFEEIGRTRCVMCDRTNYQSSTEQPAVYDAYCVACRGLYRLYTRTRGMTDAEAKTKLLGQKPPTKIKFYGTETGRFSNSHSNQSAKPSEQSIRRVRDLVMIGTILGMRF